MNEKPWRQLMRGNIRRNALISRRERPASFVRSERLDFSFLITCLEMLIRNIN
jgi:hypothetical protein